MRPQQLRPCVCTQVHMCSLGSGLSVEESFELYCGDGEQVLQWLGYASCARLAYKRGGAGGAGHACARRKHARARCRCCACVAWAAPVPEPLH